MIHYLVIGPAVQLRSLDSPTSLLGTFSCMDGEFVLSQLVCDGRTDCRDGSDEAGCEYLEYTWNILEYIGIIFVSILVYTHKDTYKVVISKPRGVIIEMYGGHIFNAKNCFLLLRFLVAVRKP